MLREVPGQCPQKFPLLGTVSRDVKHNKVQSGKHWWSPLGV